MSFDFQVVFEDILKTSNTFHGQAQVYDEIIGAFIEPPSVADETLDESIQAVLQSISLMNEMLSKSMDGHSAKLKIAHNNYKSAENLTSEQLYKILENPDAIG